LGFPRRLLPFISALLLASAFPPLGAHLLAFVALVPLLLYLSGPDTRRGRVLTMLGAGFLFHLVGFAWIRHVTWAGMAALALYAALYWLLFAGALALWRGRERGAAWPFAAAAAWTVLEYVRSVFLSGIPWFMVGHSQAPFLRFAQVADLAGVPGVTFLVVFTNAAIAHEVLRRREAARGVRPTPALGAALMLLAAAVVYGGARLSGSRDPHRSGGPDVLIVQGNIEQSVKKDGRSWREIYAVYERLTREAAAAGPPPGIVLWPETMHPALPVEFARAGEARPPLDRLPAFAPSHFVVGVLLYEKAPDGARGREWNSAVAVDATFRVTGRYDKVHLVPVGEYFPIQDWALWKWIIRTFTALEHVPRLEAGTSLEPLTVGRHRLGVMICYENAFPGIAREEVRRGADVLVNLSNEAWYLDSAEMDQMLAMSQFRCIETRTGMARATNSGISAILDPWGRVAGVVQDAAGRRKAVGGTLRGTAPVGPRDSLYLRWGDWFVGVCAVGFVAGAAWRRRANGKGEPRS
jgi:apolipoprotein N-acyltransferase